MSESQGRVIRQLRADLSVLSLAASVAFPVPGAPTIVIDLSPNPQDTGRWCIARTGWEDPAVLLPGEGWVPLVDVPAADRFPWPTAESLRQVPALLAAEAAAVAVWRAKRDAEQARARAMAQVVEEFLDAATTAVPVVTLQQAHGQPATEEGVSVPAPADVPGSCFAAPDVPEVEVEPEGLRVVPDTPPGPVDSEAADVDEETQAVDIRVLHERMGLGDTAQMPAIPDGLPPMPNYPPLIPEPALTA